MKKLMLIVFLLIGISCLAGDTAYHKTSKMKKYNKYAQWRRVPCKTCYGTGSKTVTKYDHKKNKSIKYQKPCVRCNGRGYKGMSKY